MVEFEIRRGARIPDARNRFCAVIGRLGFLALTALLIPVGCSKEERQKMATSIQQQTQNIAEKTQQYTQAAVEAVEEKLPAAGSISLRLDPEVEFSSANARVVSLGPGRGNVIQLSSYVLGDGPKTYPNLLIQGTTDVDSVAALVGKTIACDMYMRTSNSAPVLMTGVGKSVEVNFGSFDPQSNIMKASIYSGSLVSSDNRRVNLNGGEVIALVSGGN